MTTPDYDTDFYTWTQQQAAALRAKDWPALGVHHLAEEIDDLGRNVQPAIESQLERLLLHLLKYRYDPADRPRRGRRVTIRQARHAIAKTVQHHPALQHHPSQVFADAYAFARRLAPDATGLGSDTFPETCPWPIDQVLDEGFLPEAQA